MEDVLEISSMNDNYNSFMFLCAVVVDSGQEISRIYGYDCADFCVLYYMCCTKYSDAGGHGVRQHMSCRPACQANSVRLTLPFLLMHFWHKRLA